MDIQSILDLISQVGLLGTIAVGGLLKLNSELDKRDVYHNKRHEEMKEQMKEYREETRNEMKELKAENKADKAMFVRAIETFELSQDNSSETSIKITSIEHHIEEIRSDIRELKN